MILQPPPKSCPSYNNKGVQRSIEELFNEDLYRDVTDVFGKNNSQRRNFIQFLEIKFLTIKVLLLSGVMELPPTRKEREIK